MLSPQPTAERVTNDTPSDDSLLLYLLLTSHIHVLQHVTLLARLTDYYRIALRVLNAHSICWLLGGQKQQTQLDIIIE